MQAVVGHAACRKPFRNHRASWWRRSVIPILVYQCISNRGSIHVHNLRFAALAALRSTPGMLMRARLVNRRAASDDPWKILGLRPGASVAEVKRAYRKLALREHPDVNKAPYAKQQWLKMSRAYDMLSKSDKLRDHKIKQERVSAMQNIAADARQAALDIEYATGGDSFSAIFNDLLGSLDNETQEARVTLGKLGKLGTLVIEDVLDVLECSEDDGASLLKNELCPEGELELQQLELSTCLKRVEALRVEAEAWHNIAVQRRNVHDRDGELEALEKVSNIHQRRQNLQRRILHANERIEAFKHVLSQSELHSREQQRTLPSEKKTWPSK